MELGGSPERANLHNEEASGFRSFCVFPHTGLVASTVANTVCAVASFSHPKACDQAEFWGSLRSRWGTEVLLLTPRKGRVAR